VPEFGLSEFGKDCRILTMVDCVCLPEKMIYAFKKRISFFEIYKAFLVKRKSFSG